MCARCVRMMCARLSLPASYHEGSINAEPSQSVREEEAVRVERLLLQVPEAARILGVSASGLYERARRGEVKTVRIGRRVLVPLSELQRLAQGTRSRDEQVEPR